MSILRQSVLLFALASGLAFMPACIPQWRVFQHKVPAPVGKTVDQIEVERRAADLLAHRVTAPQSMIPVAQGLSSSLGAPSHPITQKDDAKAAEESVSELRKENLAYQKRIAALNTELAGYQGKDIEGTGINLFGGSVFLSFAAVVAACVFIPGFGGLLLWFIGRLRRTATDMVHGIELYKTDDPQGGNDLQEWLSSKLDASGKLLIKKIRKNIDPTDINEVLKQKLSAVEKAV